MHFWDAELLKEPKKAKEIGKCTDVACGAEFTMWLCDGRLYSAGLPQYGQLGHGTDHEYNAKDCKPFLQQCALHNQQCCSRVAYPLKYQLHWQNQQIKQFIPGTCTCRYR